ncbi:hypothetical protein D3C81_754890 [compost metagenome]|uniref:hypothetical protein n=1 Tax=Pseudomonas pudica TaxID=272772 RepID=UPI000FB4D9B9|nr:hypothetical protein [Pseudomonas pudica]
MKLVANRVNGLHLRDLLPVIGVEVDYVLAAVAYGSSASDITQDLVGVKKLRLDLWMRYDHTVPVSIELLKRLLKHQKDNVFMRFVPDRFHLSSNMVRATISPLYPPEVFSASR